MCQIFRVHIFFFSVENFSSLFFSSFIQSNKKKLRQDASNRNPKAMEQPLQGGGFWFHWFWVRRKPAAPTRSLSQASYTGGRGRGGCGGGGWGWGLSEVSSATPPPLWSPSMSLPNHSSLALKLADSASFLSVLKQDRMALNSTFLTAFRYIDIRYIVSY